MLKRKDYLLGELLIKKGLVSLGQITAGLKEQENVSDFLGRILVKKGFLKESALLEVLSDQLAIPYVDLSNHKIPQDVVKLIPGKIALHYGILPLDFSDGKITLICINPLDQKLSDELPTLLGCPIEFAIGMESQIVKKIQEVYGLEHSAVAKAEDFSPLIDTCRVAENNTHDLSQDGDAEIINLVNRLLVEAHEANASDIHIEPYENDLKIRYRIDGALNDRPTPDYLKNRQSAILSRVKIMANLDISEKRLPQDGRIKIKTTSGLFDLRVSFLPTNFGQSLVIRVLSQTDALKLDSLGFSDLDASILRDALGKPHGLILLTGPTGSGKTTTLYSCLKILSEKQLKIITIEDPVEYQIKGVVQIQVHPKIGLTFAEGLKHILRHDPDCIMVGEIRDEPTAEIAVRSSMTGHLVLSTLHTQDAPSAIARLIDMGIAPFVLSSALSVIVAQRLVRRLCDTCKQPTSLDKESPLGARFPELVGSSIFSSNQCESCRMTGFNGRTVIYEIFTLTDILQKAISKEITTQDLRELFSATGSHSLRQCGIEKVIAGLTSADELARII